MLKCGALQKRAETEDHRHVGNSWGEISHHVCEINVPAEIWTSVTLDVFKTTKKEYPNCLKIIWREDRRGVQTAVLRAGNSLQLKFIFYLFIYLVGELASCHNHVVCTFTKSF